MDYEMALKEAEAQIVVLKAERDALLLHPSDPNSPWQGINKEVKLWELRAITAETANTQQAEEITELRFRINEPYKYFLREARKKDNCLTCTYMRPPTISYNPDRISCEYQEGWPHWSTKCNQWEKKDALKQEEVKDGSQ